MVCGFGKSLPQPTFTFGHVYTVYPFIYQNKERSVELFVYITAKASSGDSGAGCFGTDGLMAMNPGMTRMPSKYHQEAISEAAIYAPNNYMIPVYRFLEEIGKLESRKPPKRLLSIGFI
ncbi:unnamed protein product [Auanema sp. JU1783]|nr:unnamed protein product [Auanema sp. JU1783]